MLVTLSRSLPVLDASDPSRRNVTFTISAGYHDIEEIPNPFGHAMPWIVLKGTKIGAVKSWWGVRGDSMQSQNPEIVIEC